jgi:hypothetical protein
MLQTRSHNHAHLVFCWMHRDLKGKEWVLGSNGEVLAVEHLNIDKLLPTQPSPPVHIHDSSSSDIHGTVVGGSGAARRRSLSKAKATAAVTTAVDNSDSNATTKQQQRHASTKGRHKSPALSATSAATYFVLDPVVQPSYIETLQLSSGVALKQNDAVKQGPELPADPQHMSRAEFQLRTRQWDDASAAADMRSVASGSLFSATAATASVGGAGDNDSTLAAGLTPRSSETASLQQSATAVVLPSTRVSNRTSDPLAGAVHSTTAATSTGSNGGGDTSAADYDPHWQLYRTPEFSNPPRSGPAPLARLPHKPPTTAAAASAHAASAHYYYDDGAVSVSDSAAASVSVRASNSPSPPRRDRGGAAGMPPTREAKHLPQPPVGYTMGHGLHTPAGGSVVSALSVGSEVLSPQAVMQGRSSGAKGSSSSRARGVVHKRKSDATIQALLLR